MPCEVTARVRSSISSRWVQQRLTIALKKLHYNLATTDVSVALVNDQTIRTLNRQYRQHNDVTDVLSFSGTQALPTRQDLGEIVISIPQARRQARQYGHQLGQEVELLLIHGLLHLIGHDHHTRRDRTRMQRLEQKLLTGNSLIHRAMHS